MIPVLLIDELCTFLTDVVAEYSLQTTKDTEKAPQVVPGWLPPKEEDEEDTVPYVVARLVDGESDNESSATVKILVGCYAEDAQGWRDPANVMEHIRQALLRKRVIGKKFRLELPIKWELPEEQPYPHWVGAMTTQWTIASVIEEVIIPDECY